METRTSFEILEDRKIELENRFKASLDNLYGKGTAQNLKEADIKEYTKQYKRFLKTVD